MRSNIFIFLVAAALGYFYAAHLLRDKKPKDASEYRYKMESCVYIYGKRENKDSIFNVLTPQSYIAFRCIDNGYLYVYTIDTSNNYPHMR